MARFSIDLATHVGRRDCHGSVDDLRQATSRIGRARPDALRHTFTDRA